MYKIFVFMLVLMDFIIFIVYLCKEIVILVYIIYDDGDIECRIIY